MSFRVKWSGFSRAKPDRAPIQASGVLWTGSRACPRRRNGVCAEAHVGATSRTRSIASRTKSVEPFYACNLHAGSGEADFQPMKIAGQSGLPVEVAGLRPICSHRPTAMMASAITIIGAEIWLCTNGSFLAQRI